MTFWAWLAQFINNMFLVVLVKFLFGKDQFTFYLLAFVTLFLNFNLLPFIYIILGDESFKRAIANKEYSDLVKLMLEFKV
jgi:hypothetical protein